MTKPICIAPTNEPDTCRVCGKKLASARIFSVPISLSEATEEQVKEWPRNPVWVTHENSEAAAFHGVYFADRQHAYLQSEDKGLNRYLGSWRENNNTGDGHFCSVHCALTFARIAANAGLRLPSVTPKQRRELRRNHKVVLALCPEVLQPEPRPVPSDWEIKREGKLTPRGKRFKYGTGPELWVYRSGKLCRSRWDTGGIGTRIEDRSAPVPKDLTPPREIQKRLRDG